MGQYFEIIVVAALAGMIAGLFAIAKRINKIYERPSDVFNFLKNILYYPNNNREFRKPEGLQVSIINGPEFKELMEQMPSPGKGKGVENSQWEGQSNLNRIWFEVEIPWKLRNAQGLEKWCNLIIHPRMSGLVTCETEQFGTHGLWWYDTERQNIATEMFRELSNKSLSFSACLVEDISEKKAQRIITLHIEYNPETKKGSLEMYL